MKTNRIGLLLVTSLAFIINVICTSAQQNFWTQKTDVNGIARNGAVGFSIGGKGYIGTGYSSALIKNDFWEFDTISNVWAQRANFPGIARSEAIGFSIGSKGYIGLGTDMGYYPAYQKDFWEYNPTNNTWIQKADFAGTGRRGAVGFSIGAKGYIGTGYDNANGYVTHGCVNDFWEFDTISNAWEQKANFPGIARSDAIGFSIGSKGYIGLGTDGGNNPVFQKDFWEYNPTNNTWIQKADFAGTGRRGAVGFSIGAKGYIGTGYDNANGSVNDFFEFNPTNNTWTQKENFGGIARSDAVGFSIGKKGFIGTGLHGNGIISDKIFWQYNPNNIPVITKQPTSQIKCIGDNAIFIVMAICDNPSYQWEHDNIDINGATKDTLIILNVCNSDSGNYTCTITTNEGNVTSTVANLKTNPVLPFTASISITNSGPICSGSYVSFSTKVLNGGTLPKYNWKVNGFDVIWFLNGYSGFGSSDLVNGDSVSCEVISNATCISGDNSASCGIKLVMDTNVVRITISKTPLDFVCKGTNVTFNATTMNGGPNPLYQWKLNGRNVGTNNPVFSSSNLLNGDTVTCELTSNASCVTNNVSLSNPLLATIYSFPPVHESYIETSVCNDCSTTLNAIEGSTYFWSPAEGLSATNIKNPIANPFTTTTYTVQISDSNGCTCTDTTNVIVKPSFSIEAINDTTIQKGQSLILGIKPILYNVKISFYLENTFSPKHFIIKNSKTGKTVFISSGNEDGIMFSWWGGSVESTEKIESGDYYIDALRVWSGYSVIPSVGTLLNNNNFTVGGKDYTYSWQPKIYLDNASIANPKATPLTDTQYIVTVNTNQGCVAKDTLNVKVINNTGLNIQKTTNDYVIYPNPVSESFQINGIDEVVTIRIIDVSGRIMLSKQLVGNEQIFVSSLPKGLYIVKIYTNKGGIERKLVKK